MKIISQNVYGLGNSRTVRRLRYVLKSNGPQVVFLMETKLDGIQMEQVRTRSGFNCGIDVSSNGSMGV